jgi:hypothetical protein
MAQPVFTPGPWEVSGDGYKVRSKTFETFGPLIDIKSLRVKDESGFWTEGRATPRKANACLVAAAPELYQVLMDAIECGMVPKSSAKEEGGATRFSHQVAVADRIREVLAKARGEFVG